MLDIFLPANGAGLLAVSPARLPEGMVRAALSGGVLQVTVNGEPVAEAAVAPGDIPEAERALAHGSTVAEAPGTAFLARLRAAGEAVFRHASDAVGSLAEGGRLIAGDGAAFTRFARTALLAAGLAAVVSACDDGGREVSIHPAGTPSQSVTAPGVSDESLRAEDRASPHAWAGDTGAPRLAASQSASQAPSPGPTDTRTMDSRPGGWTDTGHVLPVSKPPFEGASVPLPGEKPEPPVQYDLPEWQEPKAAIVTAAARTGASLPYLMMTAEKESGFETSATAGSSSASGLFQFTEQTWYATLVRYGDSHTETAGLADLIRPGKLSGYTVRDPADKPFVQGKRFDPFANALMAAELSRENRANLEAAFGHEPDDVELYMAHLLGAREAKVFLRMVDSHTDAPAAPHLPEAAASNPGVFLIHDGGGRRQATFGEIRAAVEARFEQTRRLAAEISPNVVCHAAEGIDEAVHRCINDAHESEEAVASLKSYLGRLSDWRAPREQTAQADGLLPGGQSG